MSITWVLLTLAASLACAALAWVIGLANAMCTVPRRLAGGQLALIAAPWLAAVAMLAWQMSQSAGATAPVLLWNGPALLLLLAVAIACAADRFGDLAVVRRSAARRRSAAERKAMAAVGQQHGRRATFDLRVEVGRAGRFADAHETERPGVEWRIAFTAEGGPGSVTVRSFAAASDAKEIDGAALLAHARCVLDDLEARLRGGWRPPQGDADVFVECSPLHVAAPPA